MKRCLGLATAFLAVQIALGGAWAAPDQPTEVSTRVRRVALFKNGLAFVVREGALPNRAGPLVVKPLPAATHGTLWLSYAPGVGLSDVAVRKDTLREPLEAVTIAELIQANVGKRVTAWLPYEQPTTVTGTIIAFPGQREAPVVDPYAAGPATAPSDRYRAYPAPPGAARLVLIQTDQGVTALDPTLIRRLDFPGEEPAHEFQDERPAVALYATLDKPTSNRELLVSYLSKGMTWAPSYIVDISDPKTARLSAKAVFINELEDLEGVQVDLVTGFPHLQFSDVVSPLALKENLQQFLGSLTGERRPTGAAARGMVTQQVMYQSDYAAGEFAGPAVVPTYPTAGMGQRAEDLFLYPLDRVTLAKGDVGYFGLFTESVPYRHIYQWEIPDYVSEEDRYGEARSEEREQPEVVWHCLRLENTTKIPWTTAPAQTVQKDQILGQDILNYTNPEAKTVLKITQALGVKAEQRELEIEREREALRMYGYVYDRITVKGELRVQNFKPETIAMEISKTFSGELQASDPQGAERRIARGLKRMNPVSVLTWELEVPSGEARDITYSYVVLIRR